MVGLIKRTYEVYFLNGETIVRLIKRTYEAYFLNGEANKTNI
jgi:hypothetical protein